MNATCLGCEAVFGPKSHRQKYCDAGCQQRTNERRRLHRERSTGWRKRRRCRRCGASFLGRSDERFCSSRCKVIAAWGQTEDPTCPLSIEPCRGREGCPNVGLVKAGRRYRCTECRSCLLCHEPISAAGRLGICIRCWINLASPRPAWFGSRLCAHCGERFASSLSSARYCSRRCNARANRSRGPSSVARRRATYRLRKLRARVLARYGFHCYLCDLPIDGELASPHPRSLTIDHVVPISAGGSHEFSNLRPAHRHCNVEKGERLPAWWMEQRAGIAL